MEVVPGIYGFANGLLNFVKPLQSLCIWSVWLFDIYQSFVLKVALATIKAGLRLVNALPPPSSAALNTTMVLTGDIFQLARVLNVGGWAHTTPLFQRGPLSVTDFIITVFVEFLLVEKHILPDSTIFRVFVFVWSSAPYPLLVKWFDTLSVAVFTAFLVKRIAHKRLQIPGRMLSSNTRPASPRIRIDGFDNLVARVEKLTRAVEHRLHGHQVGSEAVLTLRHLIRPVTLLAALGMIVVKLLFWLPVMLGDCAGFAIEVLIWMRAIIFRIITKIFRNVLGAVSRFVHIEYSDPQSLHRYDHRDMENHWRDLGDPALSTTPLAQSNAFVPTPPPSASGGTLSVRRSSPYSLHHIDFSSHIRLVNSLVPQIRPRRTFDLQALHSAILHASGVDAWSLHDPFVMKRPQITVCSDVQDFCEWFLLWGVPPTELSQLTADHKAAAYALGPIARTYVEVHEVLRHLDQLPLLHFDFFTLYRYLTTKGALSDPQVASVLNLVFTEHPSYFEFFAFLSSSWWDVAKSLNGSPSCFPRRFVFRDVAPPYVSPSETTPDGAAAILKTPSTGQKNTHYLEVVLRLHGQTSVAYWDFVFNAVPPVVDTSLSIRGEFQAMLDPFKVLPITCQNRVGVG